MSVHTAELAGPSQSIFMCVLSVLQFILLLMQHSRCVFNHFKNPSILQVGVAHNKMSVGSSMCYNTHTLCQPLSNHGVYCWSNLPRCANKHGIHGNQPTL